MDDTSTPPSSPRPPPAAPPHLRLLVSSPFPFVAKHGPPRLRGHEVALIEKLKKKYEGVQPPAAATAAAPAGAPAAQSPFSTPGKVGSGGSSGGGRLFGGPTPSPAQSSVGPSPFGAGATGFGAAKSLPFASGGVGGGSAFGQVGGRGCQKFFSCFESRIE